MRRFRSKSKRKQRKWVTTSGSRTISRLTVTVGNLAGPITIFHSLTNPYRPIKVSNFVSILVPKVFDIIPAVEALGFDFSFFWLVTAATEEEPTATGPKIQLAIWVCISLLFLSTSIFSSYRCAFLSLIYLIIFVFNCYFWLYFNCNVLWSCLKGV